MKRELSYQEIEHWIIYFCQKFGVKDKKQSDDQIFAGMQTLMAVTKAVGGKVNGSSSKS